MESNWHRVQMELLIAIVDWQRRGRVDYFCGGNMFIYFSAEQVRNREYRGPDFFLANGVDRHDRPYWAIWDEGGKFPDLIIELMSPSTRNEDLKTKFKIYQDVFTTSEYVAYDPDTNQFHAWRKRSGVFQPLAADANGRYFLEQAGMSLGHWRGDYRGFDRLWLRFFDDAGTLVPVEGEAEKARAEAERERADAEKARADALAAELARLKAQLEHPK